MTTVGGSSQLPDWLHEMLIRSASSTSTFLTNLTADHEEFGGVRKAAMPKTAFKNVKALCFIQRRKWGLLAGYQRELGFITRRIIADDGTISWSPPLFIKCNLLSLGATLGTMKCGICLALMNEEAIQSATHSSFESGISAYFLVDMNGAMLRKARIDSTWTEDNVVMDSRGGMAAKYFRLEAMMVDLSIKIGKSGLWSKVNDALYGQGFNPAEVLEGKVARPVEFFTVYEILNKLTSSARPQLKPTASGRGMQFKIDRSYRGGDRSNQDSMHGANNYPAETTNNSQTTAAVADTTSNNFNSGGVMAAPATVNVDGGGNSGGVLESIASSPIEVDRPASSLTFSVSPPSPSGRGF